MNSCGKMRILLIKGVHSKCNLVLIDYGPQLKVKITGFRLLLKSNRHDFILNYQGLTVSMNSQLCSAK